MSSQPLVTHRAPQPAPAPGPCGPARAEVDTRCAEAERLSRAAVEHQERLRAAKLQLAKVTRDRELDSEVRNRRRLGDLKEQARRDYHEALAAAKDRGAVHDAAAAWLHEIDRLNRRVDIADRRADEVARRAAELEGSLPAIERAADAARISAEAAQVECLEARRTLAACEEEGQRRAPAAASAAATAVRSGATAAPSARRPVQHPPIALMLRGDRATLLGLARRLADETGLEAGRLQLLLLELREAIVARALDEHELGFPARHPFWSQFSGDEGRRLAASLAGMGFHFDGHGGWADGHSPTVRELAIALSHCGYDPRSLRRPAGQAAIDGMWQGTAVLVEDYVVARAPDLALSKMIALLGPRAAQFGELWDLWGRLRPLLLPASVG